MNLIKMKCENCGSHLEVNKDLEKIICNYCGAEILIEDEATRVKRIEDVKLKARKDNHEQLLKERNDILEQEIKEKKIKDELNSVEKFKKGKLSKLLLVFFAIALLSFYGFNGFLIKFLCLTQAIIFIVSWLMGMRILKEPFKGFRIILAIIGFILIVPIINIGGSPEPKYEEIEWDEIVLNELLPEPDLKKIDVGINDEDYLSMEVGGMSKSDYKDYIKECKEFGFDIDIDKYGDHFSAYDADGNKINLSYQESQNEVNIRFEKAMEMKRNQWPDNDIAKLLPEPKSEKGNLNSEDSNGFLYYASNTSEDDFDEYINELKKSGFNVDFKKADDYYKAYNKDGYCVTVNLKEFDIMSIDVDVPSEDNEKEMNVEDESDVDTEDETDAEEKETDTEEKKEDSYSDNKKEESLVKDDAMRKEFKEAMDNYEEFMDEYVAFMKKYSESNGSDLELMTDYTTYLTKYGNMVDAFSKWEGEDLNTTEEAYYLQVQTRVSKKLLEVNY